MSTDLIYLEEKSCFQCCFCGVHIGCRDDIISKGFHGESGRAFLMSSMINVNSGPSEVRMLMTGSHTVADIFCTGCNNVLGWKYEDAQEPSQRYKIGKFIVEKSKIIMDEW